MHERVSLMSPLISPSLRSPLFCSLSTEAAWLWIDSDQAHSTCEAKSAALKFLLWFATSDVVTSLVEPLDLTQLPALYLAQSGLLDTIRKEIQCDGSSLVGG